MGRKYCRLGISGPGHLCTFGCGGRGWTPQLLLPAAVLSRGCRDAVMARGDVADGSAPSRHRTGDRVTNPVPSRERSSVRGAAGSGWSCSRSPACSCSCEQPACEAQLAARSCTNISGAEQEKGQFGPGHNKAGVSSLSRYIFVALEWKWHRGMVPAGQAVQDGPTGLSLAADPAGHQGQGLDVVYPQGREGNRKWHSWWVQAGAGEVGCARPAAG